MSKELSHNSANTPPAAVYLATTVVIFCLTLSAADSIGFVPDYLDGSAPHSTSGTPTSAAASGSQEVALSSLPELGQEASAPPIPPGILPDHIKIDSISLDLPVQNIDSRDIQMLDDALMKGPVRYVDSAELNQPGNMLIFAHSSHLPIVHNQMFKAFNRIPELKEGDEIVVSGGGKQFLYTVTSVRKTDANEAVIDLSPKMGTKLTLSTCDTLTSKSSRFVVEADLVGSM